MTARASSLISCTVSIPTVIAFPTRRIIYFFVLRVIGIVHNPAEFLLAHLVLVDRPFQHRAVTQAIGKALRRDAASAKFSLTLLEWDCTIVVQSLFCFYSFKFIHSYSDSLLSILLSELVTVEGSRTGCQATSPPVKKSGYCLQRAILSRAGNLYHSCSACPENRKL